MRTLSALAVSALIAANAASAQAPASVPATPATSTVIEGLALDSLHKGFLRGAIIMVEGATATTTTDSSGRFRLEGLPPGSHRIGVIHPLLDTLGISLLTRPLSVTAGSPTLLTVSVPSPRTTVAIKCSEAERVLGPAALVGFVVFAESESPAVGANVNLEWIDYEVSRTSVRTVPRRRVARVDKDGHFQICGLPEQLEATLSAESSTDTTTEISVAIPGVLGVAALELSEPGKAASGATYNATLTGTILDPGGRPLERARVSVDSMETLSGPDGKFTLRNLKTGTRSLLVRRLGFDVTAKVVALRERTATDVTVAMNPFTPLLDTVVVRAIAGERALDRVGFNRRKQVGSGFFLTPQEISQRSASRLTDLLAMAPNLRRTFVNGQAVISGRLRPTGLNLTSSCVVFVVDGIQWRNGGLDDFVMPAEVAAIEVYSRNFTPGDYDRSLGQCETVVIWTKWKLGMR